MLFKSDVDRLTIAEGKLMYGANPYPQTSSAVRFCSLTEDWYAYRVSVRFRQMIALAISLVG